MMCYTILISLLHNPTMRQALKETLSQQYTRDRALIASFSLAALIFFPRQSFQPV